MRFRLSRSPFFRCAATAIVAALTQAPAPAAALSFSAALFSADGEGRSPAYRDAQSALDQARWEEAAQRFALVRVQLGKAEFKVARDHVSPRTQQR